MSTNTLTDRYIYDVVRRIPADQREDVAQELRGTIADTIEARATDDVERAEREVLTEMGEPIALAAQYADRPNVLIGPALYPTYIRLLTIVFSSLLPVVVVLMVILDVLDGEGLASILGTALWVTFSVGAHIIAWFTVVFALMERARRREGAGAKAAEWSVDDLPEVPPRDGGGGGAVASAAANAIAFALIVWQHVARPFRADAGEQIAILDPALWSGWIWPILIGLLLAVVLQVMRMTAGGWTRRLVLAYLGVEVLLVAPLAWILHQQMLFNPAFLAQTNQDWTTPDEVYTGAAVIVLLIAVSGIVTRFRQVRR